MAGLLEQAHLVAGLLLILYPLFNPMENLLVEKSVKKSELILCKMHVLALELAGECTLQIPVRQALEKTKKNTCLANLFFILNHL
jgi:hypothetical protein